MKVNLPTLLTEKDGLVYVRTHDEHYIHQSFELENGTIVVFESIPGNYPSNALVTFKNREEYIESIKEVSWINDSEYIIKNNLEEDGFPFNEEE